MSFCFWFFVAAAAAVVDDARWEVAEDYGIQFAIANSHSLLIYFLLGTWLGLEGIREGWEWGWDVAGEGDWLEKG